MADYVVVLGADADAWFLPDEQPMQMLAAPTDVGPVDVTFRTRFAVEGYESPVPREMWIDVRGSADADLATVTNAFVRRAAMLLPPIAVASNAYVGDSYPKIAYEATPTATLRPFFQSFNREEMGTVPRPGRWIESEATIKFIDAALRHPRSERLFRAMGQYALALGHWRFGHETLAVAHLFIAAENLTKIALDAELATRGLDRSGLADAWGVDSRALDSEVRKRLIFRGDSDVYAAAKRASDGFEHGFLDFDRVRLLSRDVRDATAANVRQTIIEHTGVDNAYAETLMSPPRDIPLRSFLTRYLWGEFVGEAEDLAMPELEYPHFEWRSRLGQFSRRGRVITIAPEETPTGRFNNAVQFRPTRFEAWGPEGVRTVQGETTAKVVRADGRIEDAEVTSTDRDAHIEEPGED